MRLPRPRTRATRNSPHDRIFWEISAFCNLPPKFRAKCRRNFCTGTRNLRVVLAEIRAFWGSVGGCSWPSTPSQRPRKPPLAPFSLNSSFLPLKVTHRVPLRTSASGAMTHASVALKKSAATMSPYVALIFSLTNAKMPALFFRKVRQSGPANYSREEASQQSATFDCCADQGELTAPFQLSCTLMPNFLNTSFSARTSKRPGILRQRSPGVPSGLMVCLRVLARTGRAGSRRRALAFLPPQVLLPCRYCAWRVGEANAVSQVKSS